MNNSEATSAIFDQFEQFIALILEGGVVVGITLTALGIFGFYKQTQFPQNYPFAKNVFYIFTGVMLITSSYIFQAFDNSIFSVPNSFEYDETALYMDKDALNELVENGAEVGTISSGGLSSQIVPPKTAALIIGFMYLIGVISFVKGIYMLKDAGDINNQQGQSPIGKAIVHMGAGVIAVNINDFGCMVGDTFGTTLFCAL